jgi:hypothetical protein
VEKLCDILGNLEFGKQYPIDSQRPLECAEVDILQQTHFILLKEFQKSVFLLQCAGVDFFCGGFLLQPVLCQ